MNEPKENKNYLIFMKVMIRQFFHKISPLIMQLFFSNEHLHVQFKSIYLRHRFLSHLDIYALSIRILYKYICT